MNSILIDYLNYIECTKRNKKKGAKDGSEAKHMLLAAGHTIVIESQPSENVRVKEKQTNKKGKSFCSAVLHSQTL